jgi:hypothetical protein
VFQPNDGEIQGYIFLGCTMTQGDSQAHTREGKDGQDEASPDRLPPVAMADAVGARQTREMFQSVQAITGSTILPQASTHDEGMGTGAREVWER